MPAIYCSACGKEIPDATTACPHCGRRAGRRGLPVVGKLLLMLLLFVSVVGVFAVNKPSEDELRQAVRDRAKELQAKGMTGHALLIDVPQYADRFTYHAQFFTSEIRFTTDTGTVITVAAGQLGGVTFPER